jgi:hypothetical protein
LNERSTGVNRVKRYTANHRVHAHLQLVVNVATEEFHRLKRLHVPAR